MRTTAAAALVALLVIPPVTAFTQSPAPGEYDIKAVFLYNFTRYVEWPKHPKSKASPSPFSGRAKSWPRCGSWGRGSVRSGREALERV